MDFATSTEQNVRIPTSNLIVEAKDSLCRWSSWSPARSSARSRSPSSSLSSPPSRHHHPKIVNKQSLNNSKWWTFQNFTESATPQFSPILSVGQFESSNRPVTTWSANVTSSHWLAFWHAFTAAPQRSGSMIGPVANWQEDMHMFMQLVTQYLMVNIYNNIHATLHIHWTYSFESQCHLKGTTHCMTGTKNGKTRPFGLASFKWILVVTKFKVKLNYFQIEFAILHPSSKLFSVCFQNSTFLLWRSVVRYVKLRSLHPQTKLVILDEECNDWWLKFSQLQMSRTDKRCLSYFPKG